MNPSSDSLLDDFDQLAPGASRPSQSQNIAGAQKPRRPKGEAVKKKGAPESAVNRVHPRELTTSPPPFRIPPNSPVASPLVQPLASRHGETSASPVLSALAVGTPTQYTSSAHHTNESTKNLPAFDAPSTAPTSDRSRAGAPSPSCSLLDTQVVGDVKHGTPAAPPPQVEAKSVAYGTSSNTPPQVETRPVGYSKSQTQPADMAPPGWQSINQRTAVYSSSNRPVSQHASPPLPHLPQSHFYSAQHTSAESYSHSRPRLVAGEENRFCGFDTVPLPGGRYSAGHLDVLLIGWQGGLEVFKVDKNRLELVGRLEGLRGNVVGAKILPCTIWEDRLSVLRPMVAVVVHGPLIDVEDGHDAAEIDDGGKSSAQQRTSQQQTFGQHGALQYQTTVEVYSLQGAPVATLLKSPLVEASTPVSSPLFSPPPPVGGLQINAGGRFVTIASSKSGEVFLFALEEQKSYINCFKCLGKIWTTVQTCSPGTFSGSSSSSSTDGRSGTSDAGDEQSGMPMLALSQRWLAYSPAVPSSTVSINATASNGESPPSPSLSSHTAPTQPQITCAVDTPEGESFFNRVAREVTQEVLKGAKWMGDQGMQAWRNYWNKPSAEDEAGPNARGQNVAHGMSQQRFPPTHAHAVQQPSSSTEPSLVSVLDLEKLARVRSKPARLSPVGTFQAPLGCSFLSFAPQGLMLFTASRKGDVQFVWDLMRMVHGQATRSVSTRLSKTAGQTTQPRGPSLRQVARFQRMTVANIVDVVWAKPQGEKLAIVTEKGTVHLLDLPSNAFQWPPPRRMLRPLNETTSDKVEVENQSRDGVVALNFAGSSVSAAVKMVSDRSQPFLAAARNRRQSSAAGFGGLSSRTVTATSMQGGKYVASGLSKSLGAASGSINNLRTQGETRLHLPGHGEPASPRSVTWLNGSRRSHIAVVGSGVLGIHRLEHSYQPQSSKRAASSKRRAIEIDLPKFSSAALAPATMAWLQEQGTEIPGVDAVTSGWLLNAPAGFSRQAPTGNIYPLSYAEIETNAPYQPFHTDHRISLFTVDDSSQAEPAGTTAINETYSRPWVFGNPIKRTPLSVGNTVRPDNENAGGQADPAGPVENVLHLEKDDENVEQIVVTTRRRRRAHNAESDDLEDGFFEDDCEVLDYASERV